MLSQGAVAPSAPPGSLTAAGRRAKHVRVRVEQSCRMSYVRVYRVSLSACSKLRWSVLRGACCNIYIINNSIFSKRVYLVGAARCALRAAYGAPAVPAAALAGSAATVGMPLRVRCALAYRSWLTCVHLGAASPRSALLLDSR